MEYDFIKNNSKLNLEEKLAMALVMLAIKDLKIESLEKQILEIQTLSEPQNELPIPATA